MDSFAILLYGALATHFALLVLCVWIWVRGRSWGVALSQILLGFYIVSLAVAGLGLGPIAFVVLGPYSGPWMLLELAVRASGVGFLALLIGCAAALPAAIAMVSAKSRVGTRLATLFVQLAFFASAWLAAEGLTELRLRTAAEWQFPNGYCIVSRSSVPTMIELGVREHAFGTHATLVDGKQSYNWSFARTAWMPQANKNFIERHPGLYRCGR